MQELANRFRVQNIANTSDEIIKMFKDTPIFSILKQRREFCRNIEAITEENKKVNLDFLNYYDHILKDFFNII